MSEKSMAVQFEEAKPKTEVNVSEFDHLITALRGLRDRKDELNDEVKRLNGEIDHVEAEILNFLNKTGKKNWEVPGVGLAYKYEKLEVKFPQNIEDRRKFENWLKEKYGEEMRGTMFTVNYQSLNKFYNEEYEKAVEKGLGDSFKIDGLDAPTSKVLIGFRRK